MTLLAALLRFPTLDLQSYWVDEAVTVELVRKPFFELVAAIPNSESTPPLYYMAAWGWAKLFGTGEVGLRSLSALFGTLTVPAVYAAAAALVSRRAALVAAALVAVNPLLVWYSQEARAYALLVLFAAVTLWLTALARRSGSRGLLAAWALGSVAALATHYFAVFFVGPQGAVLLLAHGARGAARRATVAVAVGGVVLLPLAVHQAGQERADFIENSPLVPRLAQVPKQYLVGFDAPGEAVTVAVAALLVAYALGLLVLRGRARRGLVLPLVLVLVGVGVPLALAFAGLDYLITRNIIGALVPVLVVVAAGFAASRSGLRAAAALAAVSIVVVVAVAVMPEFQRENWRGAARALGPARADRAIVVTPGAGATALRLYLPGLEPLPPSGRRVQEVDLVALAPGDGPQAALSRQPLVAPPTPPFVPVEREDAETFTLVRLGVDRRFVWSPEVLARHRLGTPLPSVLFEERPAHLDLVE